MRGRCNTLGPEQWTWRSADKSPRIHFRLARLASSHDLGRENIYVRGLLTIAQNLLLANARNWTRSAGRPRGHAIGRRRRLVVAEWLTEEARYKASQASFSLLNGEQVPC